MPSPPQVAPDVVLVMGTARPRFPRLHRIHVGQIARQSDSQLDRDGMLQRRRDSDCFVYSIHQCSAAVTEPHLGIGTIVVEKPEHPDVFDGVRTVRNSGDRHRGFTVDCDPEFGHKAHVGEVDPVDAVVSELPGW